MSSLSIFAGSTALQRIRDEGLSASQFKVMVAASGGPKWFVLYGLDRYLFGEFFSRESLIARDAELITLGSSAGAWRMCCLATADPVAAIESLAYRYSHESYSQRPSVTEITQKASLMLAEVIGREGVEEIVNNRVFRTHIIAARCKGIGASRSKSLQMLALASGAACNSISRSSLSWFFQRAVFTNMGQSSPWAGLNDLDTALVNLTEENAADAMIASGSIPFVLEGVRNIAGANRGLYLDGGITDYHFDIPFYDGDDLVLYPHFSSRVIPGWFDKQLPWRKVHAENYHNVVLVTPSREFVAGLPFGKIPDRSDFQRLDYEERVSYWQAVMDKSQLLAEEFATLVDTGVGVEQIKELHP